MKYEIFNETKEIELDNELVKLYEECIHNIDTVSLQGMIAACGIKNEESKEIARTLSLEMIDSLELYANKKSVISEIKERIAKCNSNALQRSIPL